MSKTNALETDVLKKILQNVALPWDAVGTLYVSLHTADPGEAGDQTTNEATFGAYDRVGIVRTAVGWTVAAGQGSNAALIQFPVCTSGTNTITHVGLGTAASGAGNLLYKGALTSPASIPVATGIRVEFAIGAFVVSED